jgi:hypothetical protein
MATHGTETLFMKPKTLAQYLAVSFYLFVSICAADPVPLTDEEKHKDWSNGAAVDWSGRWLKPDGAPVRNIPLLQSAGGLPYEIP